MIRYIDMYRHRFGVECICRGLAQTDGGFITSRGYRAAKTRPVSNRSVRDELSARHIRAVFDSNYQVYGRRKMWHALRRAGWPIGRDQVARIMKDLGICGKTRGRHRVTTRAASTADIRLDLVKRQFIAHAPNQLWVADMTYVRIRSGFAYTAFITDVFSRKIVGWATASTMHTEALPLQALDQAIYAARRSTVGLIHHADHGS